MLRLILLSCLVLSVSSSDVIELSKNSFDGFIGQELSLVEFFAPWCGHCKALAPEYEIAATELKSLGVPLATVDATVEGELAGKYGVSGYPTLKIFRNGKPSDYNGPRKSQGIVSYMKKQIGPAAKPITTQQELETLITSDADTKYAVVGFFSSTSSQLHSSFAILSNRLRDEFVFGKVLNNDALASKYGVQDEAIIAFLAGEKTIYTGNSQTKNVEEFIRQHSVPLVGELTENNGDLFVKRGLPVAKYYVKLDKVKNSKQNTYYINRIKKLAQEFIGKLTFVIADKTNFKDAAQAVGFDTNVDQGFVIEKDGKTYQHDGLEGKTLDVAGLKTFITDYLAGNINPWIRSERIPKDNNGPVKIVVGQTFDDIVNDEDTDVLIEFYAPWCGHCKALEPVYKQLGEKFAGNEDVAIAKIDATNNEYDRTRFAVSGYPTIFLVPAKKNATPIKYEGGRELNDMYEFVVKNAKNKSVRNHGKKKKGGKKKKKQESDEE